VSNTKKPTGETKAALQILSRAAHIDDPRNNMRAFAATGKGKRITWLVYVAEEDYQALGEPNYISMYAEAGANVVIY
jgi:hypothetical protein